MKNLLRVATLLVFTPAVRVAHAQSNDTLHLGDVRSAAIARDARASEIELLSAQSDLRLKSIRADQLPTLSTEGKAQYQSDVAGLPTSLPGVVIPTPPHDTDDAHLDAQQRIYD